ncbi:uncharacterized protein LOC119372467 [Rhipicephalus sanguineus]|uniref:uncharacterized protein LOC119372467 n=1 Tax=Rhipicephalus sanguineus TaxID=34632 RepID=UPI0020C4F636|nr:uncharacterized protein LOC119372467 [Rhipicephalus sanguineus]
MLTNTDVLIKFVPSWHPELPHCQCVKKSKTADECNFQRKELDKANRRNSEIPMQDLVNFVLLVLALTVMVQNVSAGKVLNSHCVGLEYLKCFKSVSCSILPWTTRSSARTIMQVHQ